MAWSKDGSRWLACVAPALLVAVACVQIGLTRTAGLSPWLGGGFGMFSTSDDRGHRHLHVVEESPGIFADIQVSEELHDLARRVLALPTPPRLERLARAIRAHSPIEGDLRLEVWRTRYDPGTLRPSSHLLRSHTQSGGREEDR